MSNTPLVSTIMIFFNEEKFIQEAIDSVFAQTYENWELLLVDDGSTDKSTEIARRCATQYPDKVRYLEHYGHENRGMSATRNLGLQNVQGEYIALLDADDIWLPQKLEKQVNILNTQPEVAMVFSPSKLWYSWTGNVEDSQRDFIEEASIETNTVIRPPKLLIWSTLKTKVFSASTCSMLLRSEVFERLGGFENKFRGLYEDQAFLTKVYLHKPVMVISDCLDWYRQHPNSCVAINYKKIKAERLVFLEWVEDYLSKQGVKDTDVWQALGEELWPYRHPKLSNLLETYRHFNKQLKELVKRIGRWILPVSVRYWLRTQWQRDKYRPPLV